MLRKSFVPNLPPFSSLHLGWVGAALSIGFWFLESAIHAYIFNQHPFLEELIPREPNEFWMRLLVCLLFLIFGLMAQHLLNLHRLAIKRIRDLEHELVSMFDGIRDPIFLHDSTLNLLAANRAFLRMIGSTSEEMIGRPVREVIPGILEFEDPIEYQKLGRFAKEEEIHFGPDKVYRSRSFPVESESGGYLFTVHLLSDITSQLEAERKGLLAAKVMDVASVGIIITDSESRILAVNPAFTNITGYTEEEVKGCTPGLLKSGKYEKEFYSDMWRNLIAKGNWSGEILNRKKNGELYIEWLQIERVLGADGVVLYYIGVFSDITLKKQTEEMLIDIATHDLLTGLPNRRIFEDHLRKALRRASREGERIAILFLDLDRFKPINDTLGHDIGDMVLMEVARRITGALRPSDMGARYGGDEFVVFVDDVTDIGIVGEISERIISSIEAPIQIHNRSLQVGVSIGIALYPEDGETPEMLITGADSAMYRAKSEGGYRFAYERR